MYVLYILYDSTEVHVYNYFFFRGASGPALIPPPMTARKKRGLASFTVGYCDLIVCVFFSFPTE